MFLVSVNNLLDRLSNFAKGYKTRAAALATLLVSLGGFIGLLPSSYAMPLSIFCLGLAHIFQRMATADSQLSLDVVKQDLSEAREDVRTLIAAFTSSNPAAPAGGAAPTAFPADVRNADTDQPAVIPFSNSTVKALLFCLALAGTSFAQDRPPVLTSMQLSRATREWFRNPDGSCVQCSIGMAGVHCNDANAASLLWDTEYGAAVRGGSWPSRVENYCDQRGIKAWSVTGASVDETLPWIVWAAQTGRFAAIGAGQAHFQTLYGYEPGSDKPWLVCNNNSPQRIDRYSDRDFRQLHAASGPWVVILQKPSSDPPAFVKWWK